VLFDNLAAETSHGSAAVVSGRSQGFTCSEVSWVCVPTTGSCCTRSPRYWSRMSSAPAGWRIRHHPQSRRHAPPRRGRRSKRCSFIPGVADELCPHLHGEGHCQRPLGCARLRPGVLPGRGHQGCPLAASRTAWCHDARGFTPLPRVAWVRRIESPAVMTT
jgi:hypothetical protein